MLHCDSNCGRVTAMTQHSIVLGHLEWDISEGNWKCCHGRAAGDKQKCNMVYCFPVIRYVRIATGNQFSMTSLPPNCVDKKRTDPTLKRNNNQKTANKRLLSVSLRGAAARAQLGYTIVWELDSNTVCMDGHRLSSWKRMVARVTWLVRKLLTVAATFTMLPKLFERFVACWNLCGT